MIKLLAMDMDGTCLNEKSRITPQVMDALEAARQAGVLLVPTTGRALECLPWQLRERPGLYRYVISSNGARITDTLSGSTIFRQEIPQETALRLLARLGRRHLGRTAHVDHQYLVEGKILHAMGRAVYGRDAKTSPEVRSLPAAIRQRGMDVEELQLFFLGSGSRARTEQVLEDFPELSADYSSLYVEIYHKNASKGTALSALAEQLGLAPAEIACMGDGDNDRSMFRAAGLRLAMGNCADSLRPLADAVLPSNRESGAAAGIWEYVLKG